MLKLTPQEAVDELTRLRRELADFGNMSVRVGVQGDADSDLLMIANVHEYGCTIKVTPKMRAYLHYQGLHMKPDTAAINIPERSFIRASYDAGQMELQKIIDNALNKVISGDKTAQEAMEEIGLLASQWTQDYINNGYVYPPDKPYTLGNKSQETTLVDSGRLVGSITFKIEGGGP